MILSHQSIIKLPDVKGYVGPASVDLTLGDQFYKIQYDQVLDFREDALNVQYRDIQGEFVILAPGEFCLATTEQEVNLPTDVAGYVSGKSSLGRMGLQVENAGFCDPGFRGNITLEIVNQSPCKMVLHTGMEICQLVYIKLDERTVLPYDGKYQNQEWTQVSRHNPSERDEQC